MLNPSAKMSGTPRPSGRTGTAIGLRMLEKNGHKKKNAESQPEVLLMHLEKARVAKAVERKEKTKVATAEKENGKR